MGGSSKPCKIYNDNGTGNGKGYGMCYVKDKGSEKDINKMAGKNDKGKYLPAGLEMKMEARKKTREAASQR